MNPWATAVVLLGFWGDTGTIVAKPQSYLDPGAQVSGGEGGWHAVEPATEEAGYRARAKPLVSVLFRVDVLARAGGGGPAGEQLQRVL